MTHDLLTSAQVAEEYPAIFPTQQSVLSAARRGVLSYYRISARRMLFSRAEIERDVQAAHVPATGGLSQKAASKITFLNHTKTNL